MLGNTILIDNVSFDDETVTTTAKFLMKKALISNMGIEKMTPAEEMLVKIFQSRGLFDNVDLD